MSNIGFGVGIVACAVGTYLLVKGLQEAFGDGGLLALQALHDGRGQDVEQELLGGLAPLRQLPARAVLAAPQLVGEVCAHGRDDRRRGDQEQALHQPAGVLDPKAGA
ncbi:MAG: hypothetical protein IPM35_19295 [Myxococcales bacterium]|nr:hypothetical protein [Myxococcales bacterium]